MNSMLQTFKKGEIIFKEGEYGTCMYDIRWGSVGIYANYGKENEKLLTKLRPEEFFGEMGMLDSYPRSATAVALEPDTQAIMITAETFDKYFKERPAKVMAIMQHMSQRIRELTRDYMDACRALTEAVEGDAAEEKSGWFTEHFRRFIDDFKAGGGR